MNNFPTEISYKELSFDFFHKLYTSKLIAAVIPNNIRTHLMVGWSFHPPCLKGSLTDDSTVS